MSLKDIQAQVDEWTSQFTPQYWKQHEILAQMQEELGEIGRILKTLFEMVEEEKIDNDKEKLLIEVMKIK